ncbi:hypothetical protein HPB47_000902 [Ixodes persulcatus]|uniref:Uncharacterized protein n=1 Tax=Ixodes persulcatus TaxID=34615 RepID=A0AC60PQH6_IXOPE|nr:hypothetical protein HPB47_000902 [Ixodes persulcatus]
MANANGGIADDGVLGDPLSVRELLKALIDKDRLITDLLQRQTGPPAVGSNAIPTFQNFAIFREQPRRGEPVTAGPALPTVAASTAPATGTTSAEPCVCVRLSLPDVHLPDEKVSPSHSSYSLPSMRRRSPVVSRAKSVDARAMPFMHRLSISGRADSQDTVRPALAPLSPKLRTPSPECPSSSNLLERPVSPAPPTSPRPRSLSPLLSPAYTSNSDPGAASPIGNIQPDLYKKKETVFFQSREARSSSCGSPSGSGGSVASKFGRLHFRLKYDFDKSDLVVHVIEAMELGLTSGNGFHDPYVKVSMLPKVDTKERQTLIRRNSTDPFFNETFKFPVSFDDLPLKTLLFQIETGRGGDSTKNPWALQRELLLHVLQAAMELGLTSGNGFHDPYVKVSMLPKVDTKERQTLIRRNSTDPFFNETFKFPVSFDDLPLKTLLFQSVSGF